MINVLDSYFVFKFSLNIEAFMLDSLKCLFTAEIE